MANLKTGDDFDTGGSSSRGSFWRHWLAVPAIFGIVLVSASVLYVWLYIQQVQNGYKLAKLSEEQEQLLSLQRKLRLEWSQFENPFRLEDLGRQQFGLTPPKPEQKILMR